MSTLLSNKELKRLMTDVAKGRITQENANHIIEDCDRYDGPEDVVVIEIDEIEVETVEERPKKTQKRKLNPKKKILKKQEMSS